LGTVFDTVCANGLV